MTYCGGASSISPAACAASASSGPNHWSSSVSAPSAIALPPATGPAKNHVANRFGEISGVVQFETCTSASGSTSTPASSFASRAAARRAAASRSSASSPRSPRDRCDRRGTPTRRRGTPASTTGGRATPRARCRRRATARPSPPVPPRRPLGSSAAAASPFPNPAVRQRGRPSRAGRAAPSCRTCRPTSSGPRR